MIDSFRSIKFSFCLRAHRPTVAPVWLVVVVVVVVSFNWPNHLLCWWPKFNSRRAKTSKVDSREASSLLGVQFVKFCQTNLLLLLPLAPPLAFSSHTLARLSRPITISHLVSS